MISLCLFLENNKQQNLFKPNDAQQIINSNKKEPTAKAVVNINPKSTTDILSQKSNSAQQAASSYTNSSLNAGQRHAALSGKYTNTPERIPSRLAVNPTFTASSI